MISTTELGTWVAVCKVLAPFRSTAKMQATIAVPNGFPAHWGVLAAFLLAAVLYYFIFYTSKGFKLRAVGMNATAAFFNGFPVNKYILFSFITSGHNSRSQWI